MNAAPTIVVNVTIQEARRRGHMTINIKDLTTYINALLKPELFKDYAPNGMQVEGKTKVKKIVTAVTASLNIINQAIKQKADVLLVHHGYFWPGESPVITGIKKQRIAELLNHDINLLAYHLPLDAHATYGNNTELAKLLGIQVKGTLDSIGNKPGLVFYGEFAHAISVSDIKTLLAKKLGREPLIIDGGNKSIKTIAWCTGAAQDAVQYAIDADLDAFLTGEVSERSYHQAMESNICFIAAGHHATERYGIQALGQHLADKFNVEHIFIDEDNPV